MGLFLHLQLNRLRSKTQLFGSPAREPEPLCYFTLLLAYVLNVHVASEGRSTAVLTIFYLYTTVASSSCWETLKNKKQNWFASIPSDNCGTQLNRSRASQDTSQLKNNSTFSFRENDPVIKIMITPSKVTYLFLH